MNEKREEHSPDFRGRVFGDEGFMGKSPLTSPEIIEVLSPKTNWNPKTIHTLIGRLIKKVQ